MRRCAVILAQIIFLVAAAAVGFGQIASAEPFRNGPGSAGHSWAGCYFGGNASWLRDATTIDTAPTGAFFTLAPNAADRAVNSYNYQLDDSGIGVGAQLGCNMQFNRFVLGHEIDISWSSLDSSVNAAYGAVTLPVAGGTWLAHSDSLSHRLNWFATLRERIGFTWNRALIYATGGLAVGSVNVSFSYGTTSFGEARETRYGWTAGGGIEVAYNDRWSARLEYLYVDFGTFSFDAPTIGAPTFTYTADVHSRVDIVRAGINYRWH